MKFKGPEGFERVISLQINLIVGMIVSACILTSLQGLPESLDDVSARFLPWAQSTILSFFVGFAMTDLLPTMKWSLQLIGHFRIKNAFACHVIKSVVIGSIMGTCILFFCSLINNIVSGGVMDFFWAQLLVVLAGAVGTVFVFLKPVTFVARTVTGFDPS